MAEFLQALQIVTDNEGKYNNDPDDSGHETYKGISRRFQSDWVGWAVIDYHKPDKNFPDCLEGDPQLQLMVKDFYHRYWAQYPLDKVTLQKVGNMIFDMSFPMGGHAIECLQKAVSLCGIYLKVDGKFGPKTLSSVNCIHEIDLIPLYCTQCVNHFYQRAMSDPKNKKFLNGWLNRVEKHLKGVQQ